MELAHLILTHHHCSEPWRVAQAKQEKPVGCPVPNALPSSPHPRSHLCGGSLLERENSLPLLRTPLLHFLGVAHDGVHIAVSIKAGVEVKAQVGRVLPQIHHKAAGKGDRHHSSTSLITMTASGPAPSSPEEGVQGEIP